MTVDTSQALKKVSKAVALAKDLKPAFDDIGKVVVQEFTANFDSEGGILESPWPKRQKEYAWPLLNKTGRLKSTWTTKAEPKKLTITNPVEYAKYHHFGMYPQATRPLVGATQKILQIILDRVIKFVKEELLKS